MKNPLPWDNGKVYYYYHWWSLLAKVLSMTYGTFRIREIFNNIFASFDFFVRTYFILFYHKGTVLHLLCMYLNKHALTFALSFHSFLCDVELKEKTIKMENEKKCICCYSKQGRDYICLRCFFFVPFAFLFDFIFFMEKCK